MTRLRAIVLSLLILAVPGPAGRAEERPSAEEQSPLASLHSPLEDPQAGRLYPLAADLLRAARDLPEEIDLGQFIRAEGPAAGPPPEPEAAESVAQVPQPAEAPAEGWVSVSELPIIDEEHLAYAYFRAGLYARAADAYRRLQASAPAEEHFRVMLMLSERNGGNEGEALKLLADLKSLERAKPWAEWIEHMQVLAGEPTEEGK